MSRNFNQLGAAIGDVRSAMSYLSQATARLESLEGVQTQTTNSRYVTALELYQAFVDSKEYGTDTNFKLWCKERFNAEKDPHCT